MDAVKPPTFRELTASVLKSSKTDQPLPIDQTRLDFLLERQRGRLRLEASRATPAPAIPRRFAERARFSELGWIAKTAEGKRALEHCRKFSEDPGRLRPPILTGPSGCGKTHLAFATVRAIAERASAEVARLLKAALLEVTTRSAEIERGLLVEVRWPVVDLEITTGADLASALRGSVSSGGGEALIEQLQQRRTLALGDKTIALLVVDDVEVFKAGDWLAESLYRIFDFRYAQLLPTIICSNLTLAEMLPVLGDRIVRRIRDMGELLEVR
jgi:DNA replication protein DnaC